jgi:hypothetical protein
MLMVIAHIQEKPLDDEEDLRQCMRSEEDLREYRWRMPWKGEYRFFKSENVVCIEHFQHRDRRSKFG